MKETTTSKTTLIVPCAGFGQRVGSPPAKEMLPHPEHQRPLIDGVLDIAEQHRWPLVLVTRPEKKPLIDYVTEKAQVIGLEVQWILTRKTTEWPESVLLSHSHWSDRNLLVLPDTEWQPQGIEKNLTEDLDQNDVSYGTFRTPDLRTWGCVEFSEKSMKVCEKPQIPLEEFLAWGLIAFRKAVGSPLFSALLESTMDHQVKTLPIKGKSRELLRFRDLTRSKSP